MSLLACDDGQQPPEWCPSTIEDALPSILGLLPPGPAWDGAQEAGTTMNFFWRAVAEIVAWVYQLLCLYLKEFFCDTVDQSLDQWVKAYALGSGCDPYGYNLCAKVSAIGGANCEFMVALARANGMVITCESLADRPQPMAGCFEVGCTPLGPTPVYIGDGSNLGYGDVCQCHYGTIVEHPEPQFWDTTKTKEAFCYVPGSELGQSAGAPDCCFIVGYYTLPDPVVATPVPNPCNQDGYRINFPVTNTSGIPAFERVLCGEVGSFINYGACFVWLITIYMQESQALQGVPVNNAPQSNAGNFMAGCTPLCSDLSATNFIECILNEVKPAHTELVFEVIQA